MSDNLPKDPVSGIAWSAKHFGPWGAVVVALCTAIVSLAIYIASLNSKVLDAFNAATAASTKQAMMAEQVIKIVQDEANEDRRWRELHR
ncbi:hypothetical protein TSACC_1156 [Terrimicrobium sacchariphilum]|uniref:Uncharacterized protein n=1 Tax=Terrimicrobium sacchariphilum TaxID=690879 RepID=A0A146G3H8_TERSA|nr:hypothetical protein [Terrimicrobium sacchariphilum]GAT31604.1 hypothetical protein TSACC_1156 [Terrimicrobium sacchariphilum]